MSKLLALRHEFVEFIPDKVEHGVIYVSIPYATATHKCCCGCGYSVVTPISPTDWQLTFDGKSVTLYPSIGNWSFPCKSHYFVRRNKVVWATRMSTTQITEVRQLDREAKSRYFKEGSDEKTEASAEMAVPAEVVVPTPTQSLWEKFRGIWTK